jgi:tetratricopeptide (TPR) repeat protein
MILILAVPAAAADQWIRLNTPHFEMYTTADEAKASDAILYFEHVREFFLKASPVKPPGNFPTRIVAFSDPQQFRSFAPSAIANAYFAPGPLRDTIVMQDPLPANYPVAIHEYVHLVILHSGLKAPLWLHEGWAEVFSTLKPVKDGVAVGDLNPGHIANLGHGQWFTLSELNEVTNGSPEYNEADRTGMFYAESWALTHMLYLAPDYKDKFEAFIDALNKGRSMEDAAQETYSKTPMQVLADLRSYFSRQRLFGTVFLTPFEQSGEAPVISSPTPWETNLMQADLLAASNHSAEAASAYQKLQSDDPRRPDAFAGAGYLAMKLKDVDTARRQFRMAFDRGTTDPQLCLQLAILDRAAKQPAQQLMEELDRAVKLQPDFTEAVFQLGVMKMDARDFDAALALLGRVKAVDPERMSLLYTALAYSNLQHGNITEARSGIESARKAALTPQDIQRADQMARLIEARSSGPAAVQAGEKVSRIEGTAVALRCVASGTISSSKLEMNVGIRRILLDVPVPAAVEIVRRPGTAAALTCGELTPFPVTVEFAPFDAPVQNSAGIIRRLEF